MGKKHFFRKKMKMAGLIFLPLFSIFRLGRPTEPFVRNFSFLAFFIFFVFTLVTGENLKIVQSGLISQDIKICKIARNR